MNLRPFANKSFIMKRFRVSSDFFKCAKKSQVLTKSLSE